MGASLTDRQRETAEDRRLYIEIGFTPVACRQCGVEALVKKNSHKHTSVQWSASAVAACPEIATARAADPSSFVPGCPRMSQSIEEAVRSGAVVVPDG
jgi:hypothetical protein